MENLTGLIMEYESGELNDRETIKMFAAMIESGLAWQLQGHYGRSAADLIRTGYISPKGKVLKYEID